MDVLWALHEVSPVNRFISSAVVSGLPHTESVIFCIVEIIHAFMLNETSLVNYSISIIYAKMILN